MATLVPSSAVAAPTTDGLWYADALGLDAAQQVADGAGITVAVIDGPVDPTVPELDGTSLVVHEPAFCDCDGDGAPDPATAADASASHGTSMVSLVGGTGRGPDGVPGVRGVAPGAEIRHYTIGAGIGNGPVNVDGDYAAALRQAVADGADIVSMSFGSSSPLPGEPERDAVAEALRAGVVLVAAGGNEEDVVDFPGVANGVVTVSHFGPDGEMVDGENVPGPHVDVAAPGRDIRGVIPGPDGGHGRSTGSSPSTAIVSGVLALAWSAHPEATGNQMIQALLRTTESSDGDLSRHDDWWGYGKVSLIRLLETDPTGYPDVNPLLTEGPDQVPTVDEVRGDAGVPAAPPTADAPAGGPGAGDPQDGAAAPERDTDAPGVPLALLGAVGVVAVVVMGIGVGALARRRTSPSPSPSNPVEEGMTRA
jgi:hypothetical protein